MACGKASPAGGRFGCSGRKSTRTNDVLLNRTALVAHLCETSQVLAHGFLRRVPPSPSRDCLHQVSAFCVRTAVQTHRSPRIDVFKSPSKRAFGAGNRKSGASEFVQTRRSTHSHIHIDTYTYVYTHTYTFARAYTYIQEGV